MLKVTRPVCSRNTLANCVAGDNFGTQTINGYIRPPDRFLDPSSLEKASALLGRYAGSNVRFIYIGSVDDQEISNFYNQIYRLFVNSGWHIAGASQVGKLTNYINGSISRDEGLGCSATNPSREAGQAAIQALEVVGALCYHGADGVTNDQQRIQMPGQPSLAMPPPTDLYIFIGTRILPQR